MQARKKIFQAILFFVCMLIIVPQVFARQYAWAPYKGTSKVDKSYSYQTFYFDNTAINDFKSYSGWVGYEHETQVYDVNFADYRGKYWGSNMPYAYLDSTALEPNPSIDNFTIGTTRPEEMTVATRYWTYVPFNSGTASTATVRIKGQLGYTPFAWCDSLAWCVIYPLATTGSLTTFTAPINYEKSWTNN